MNSTKGSNKIQIIEKGQKINTVSRNVVQGPSSNKSIDMFNSDINSSAAADESFVGKRGSVAPIKSASYSDLATAQKMAKKGRASMEHVAKVRQTSNEWRSGLDLI